MDIKVNTTCEEMFKKHIWNQYDDHYSNLIDKFYKDGFKQLKLELGRYYVQLYTRSQYTYEEGECNIRYSSIIIYINSMSPEKGLPYTKEYPMTEKGIKNACRMIDRKRVEIVRRTMDNVLI